MICFREKFSLKKYNTFGIDTNAKYFFEFTESEDLLTFIQSSESLKEEKLLVLGGGSNYLFVSDFEGVVLHPNIPGIRVIDEDRANVWIEAGAGEVWDRFIEYCVTCGYGGIENLSYIPGTVGATPVQNIGAYGMEAAQAIDTVYAIDLKTGQRVTLTASECLFGYRDSIFKHALKGKLIVTSVVFKLSRFPEFNLDYGAVKKEAERLGGVTLRNIRDAIVGIRKNKLPETDVLGSAGSFFMNPILDAGSVEELKMKYPEMPLYSVGEGKVKLSAGWLIEQCGWKGYREKDAGVYQNQSLVLVNYGAATGKDIYDLSERIRLSVYNQFGINIHREVIVI